MSQKAWIKNYTIYIFGGNQIYTDSRNFRFFESSDLGKKKKEILMLFIVIKKRISLIMGFRFNFLPLIHRQISRKKKEQSLISDSKICCPKYLQLLFSFMITYINHFTIDFSLAVFVWIFLFNAIMPSSVALD